MRLNHQRKGGGSERRGEGRLKPRIEVPGRRSREVEDRGDHDTPIPGSGTSNTSRLSSYSWDEFTNSNIETTESFIGINPGMREPSIAIGLETGNLVTHF